MLVCVHVKVLGSEPAISVVGFKIHSKFQSSLAKHKCKTKAGPVRCFEQRLARNELIFGINFHACQVCNAA